MAATLFFLGSCTSECEESEAQCDGNELKQCVDGQFSTVRCLEAGQLCEVDRCVDPWRFGEPVWSTCPNESRATNESLVEKATYYDEIAQRLHVHPELKWAQGVQLADGISETEATHTDVERWLSGENDGLWSALYMASQAYRYAVTRSDEALSMLRLLLEGEVTRMRITGVPGLVTRQFIPPNVPGISCPADDAHYRTDEEKDDNRWVQIRNDGCAWVVDQTGAWTGTDHCGLDEFAGFCWLDNVSKDEYSGHMFALGAILRYVDVDDVRSTVIDLLRQIAEHLLTNGVRFRDWDGRITEHGRHHPLSLDNLPGFNAAMALSYLQMAIEATGDTEMKAEYDRCFLMLDGPDDCYETGYLEILPWPDYLSQPGLYVGNDGCKSNYNNVSMHMLSMQGLISHTRDDGLLERYQSSLDVDVVRADERRAIIGQNNALFDFIWAASKKLGPGSDGPAYGAVENGICMLKQFPASQTGRQPNVDPALLEPYCKNRFDRDTGEHAKEVADRCVSNFLWWGDPYDIRPCSVTPNVIQVPTDYLLAYWMGRYYGFIPADL